MNNNNIHEEKRNNINNRHQLNICNCNVNNNKSVILIKHIQNIP